MSETLHTLYHSTLQTFCSVAWSCSNTLAVSSILTTSNWHHGGPCRSLARRELRSPRLFQTPFTSPIPIVTSPLPYFALIECICSALVLRLVSKLDEKEGDDRTQHRDASRKPSRMPCWLRRRSLRRAWAISQVRSRWCSSVRKSNAQNSSFASNSTTLGCWRVLQ